VSASIDIVQADIYKSLGDFIATTLTLAAGNVIVGLDNRVPTPVGDYVVMTILSTLRLATTVDLWDKTDPAPTEQTYQKSTRVDIQIDCYGTQAQAWNDILCTLLRDEYGCDALAPTMQPLWADEGRQIPFATAEEQYQPRWALTAAFQYNPIVTVTNEFADTVGPVTLINVDEAYPP